ncbi:MAG: hypothetical protein FJ144_06035 [Deltaproteobacteria bacterium]|nr:hypothetical protein [Deltaproteobacteria bacterium]
MRQPVPTFTLVLLLGLSLPVSAKTIFVSGNGSGTPLQDAIDDADPGDVLRLDGVFFESIVIDKPLRLLGPAAIDPGCGPANVVEIASDDVELNRIVAYGGSHATIDIEGRDDVKLTKVFVVSQPFGGGCADAEYGIRIFDSTDVSLSGCETVRSGPGHVYSGAFIYVGGIQDDANVRVRKSFSNYENTVGILVEDSSDVPTFGGLGVILRGNAIVSSVRGILLRNSDGVLVSRNRSDGNDVTGIEVDATSNNNRLEGNRAHQNGLDVLDDGSGNCWRRNDFDTGTVSCP